MEKSKRKLLLRIVASCLFLMVSALHIFNILNTPTFTVLAAIVLLSFFILLNRIEKEGEK